MAYALDGTEKSFSVSWNPEKNSIFIAPESDYKPVGGELTLSPSLIPKAAKTTLSNVYVNNIYTYFTAYGISSNNYFKLRDVAEKLNFGVVWDGAAKTIRIDTAKDYISDDDKSILTNVTSFAGTYPIPFEPGYFKGYDHPQVVATMGTVSISTDPKRMTFSYPLDPSISRTLMVKNNGTEEIYFEYNPSISIAEFQAQMFINHPQPFRFYLQPGQTQPVRLLYAMNLGPDNSGRLSAPITVECIVRTLADYNGQRKTIKLDNDVQIVGIHGTSPPTSPYVADPNEPTANATISGTLFDGLSHKTLDDVEVSVFNGRSAVAARTNSKGMFSIPVYAHQRVGTNVWSEYSVLANGTHEFTKENMFAGYHKNLAGVELADYGQARQVITVKSGEKASLKLELFLRRQTAGYKVESMLDIGLQAYEFDCTQDGNLFATVPFHTGLLSDVRAKNAYLNVFDLNGKLLWKSKYRTTTVILQSVTMKGVSTSSISRQRKSSGKKI